MQRFPSLLLALACAACSMPTETGSQPMDGGKAAVAAEGGDACCGDGVATKAAASGSCCGSSAPADAVAARADANCAGHDQVAERKAGESGGCCGACPPETGAKLPD
ncbi:MAG: hypothetical protein KF830_12175 [Planctomycetes bacterium]|nr:hypothetical protein [Planctomycetota bacterium]